MNVGASVADSLLSDPLLQQLADTAHEAAESHDQYSEAVSARAELMREALDRGIPSSVLLKRTGMTTQRLSMVRRRHASQSSEVA